jgi:hypothetical protein
VPSSTTIRYLRSTDNNSRYSVITCPLLLYYLLLCRPGMPQLSPHALSYKYVGYMGKFQIVHKYSALVLTLASTTFVIPALKQGLRAGLRAGQ